jgi:hypothetical protein
LSPIAPPDAQAAASYGFTAAFLTGHAALTFRSIGDNRSTIPPAVSSMVELLSPIALPDAQAAASYGLMAAFLTGHAALMLRSIGDNRSTIPPAVSSMVELLSPIAPPDAPAAVSSVLRLLFSPVTRPYSSDRLGTIDLPSKRRNQFVHRSCRSIIMNLLALGRFLPTTPPPTT